MPRSKRNKVVTLTKVNSKGRDLKSTMVATLQASMDEFSNLFHLKFENLRSSRMRGIRMDWRESKLFLGKNSVAKIALGRTEEEEYLSTVDHDQFFTVIRFGIAHAANVLASI